MINSSKYEVLSKYDINNLIQLYKDIGFENVNSPYNENQEGKTMLEHIPFNREFNEDCDNSSSCNYSDL